MPAPFLAAILRVDPIVITGTGIVSVAGVGADALWQAVEAKRSLARLVSLRAGAGGKREWAACPAVEPEWDGHPWRRMARRLDAGGRFALAAGHQAVVQAGLASGLEFPERCGVILGSSRGPTGKWGEIQSQLVRGRRLKPTLVATSTLGAAAGALAQMVGALGPCWLTSTACASAAHAIAQAAEQILLGHADVMLAGGADDVLHEAVLSGLESAGVLARGRGTPESWARPFGADRSGFVPGSGAGMLVLEKWSHALHRGAQPLAILAGWAVSFSPEGLVGISPEGDGLVRVMSDALALGEVAQEEIGYLNAHGTGTLANDLAEATAIRRLFGRVIPPVSSTKPVTGHCLGATAAMEAVIAVQALQRKMLPPAIPLELVDPACELPFSPGGRQPTLRHVLSNSAAFWGFQSSLLFSRVGEVRNASDADRRSAENFHSTADDGLAARGIGRPIGLQ